VPPGALELTPVPIAPVHDGGSPGHPPIVLAQSDTLAFGRSRSFSIARGGDLLLAQLLAPAAPSAEHQGLLSYNERYKHYDRLIVLGIHLAL
jgi:hypothetical protein